MSVRPVNSSVIKSKEWDLSEYLYKAARQVPFIKAADDALCAPMHVVLERIDRTADCALRCVSKTLSSCCLYPKKQRVTQYPAADRAPVEEDGPTVSVKLDTHLDDSSINLDDSSIDLYLAGLHNQNPKTKMKYYKWAAVQGWTTAQSSLDRLYQKGEVWVKPQGAQKGPSSVDRIKKTVRKSEVLARFWKGCAEREGQLETTRLQIPLPGDRSIGQIRIFDARGLTEDRVAREAPLIPKVRTPEQVKCLENMKLTRDFFGDKFQTDLLPLDAYVDVQDYAGAAWEPELNAVCYEDAPLPAQKLFLFPEVAAHEYTHGLIQHTCGPIYKYESGALEESLCDVFGIMTKQSTQPIRAGDERCDWVIGKDCYGDGTYIRSFGDKPSTALRGEDKPVVINLPGNMSEYQHTERDDGGVHTNSSIGNRAFYLAATAVQGFSWEKIGQIWFRAMLITEPEDGFGEFAQNTMIAARSFRDGVVNKVGQAWEDVGVFDEDRRTYRKARLKKAT